MCQRAGAPPQAPPPPLRPRSASAGLPAGAGLRPPLPARLQRDLVAFQCIDEGQEDTQDHVARVQQRPGRAGGLQEEGAAGGAGSAGGAGGRASALAGRRLCYFT